jgi:translation initiation factor 3 subunit I
MTRTISNTLTGACAHPNQVCEYILEAQIPRQYTSVLTSSRYNRDGDIIFSTAKDQHICAWFAHNGERLGTYHGHQGALWTVDVDPTSTLIASGAADNTVRLWDIRSGKCLKVWEFNTAVKRVEFNEDGSQLLAVTEKRMGFLGTIVVMNVNLDPEGEQDDEKVLTIECEESKATVAGWSFMNKYIIAGHEDGTVSQYDAKVGRQKTTAGYMLMEL